MNNPRLVTSQMSVTWEQTSKYHIAMKNEPLYSMSDRLSNEDSRDSAMADSADL